MRLRRSFFSALLSVGVLGLLFTGANGQILDGDGNPNIDLFELYAWYEGSGFGGLDGIAQTPVWKNSQGNSERDIFSAFGQGATPALSQVYFGNGNQGARFQDVVIWGNAGEGNWGTLVQPLTIFAVTSIGTPDSAAIWGNNSASSTGLYADTLLGSFRFGASSGADLISDEVPENTIQVHTWVCGPEGDTSISEHFINGVSQGTTDTGTGALDGIVFAGKAGGSVITDDMTYGDFLVYADALSTTDRQAIEGFLMDRYLDNPVGDIHNWVSTNATDTFGNSTAWDAAGTPAGTWDVNVQSSKTQDQVAQVTSNSTVLFANVAGNVEVVLNTETNALDSTPRSMTLDVQSGTTLTATNGLSVKGGAVLTGTGIVAADVTVEGGSINPGNSPGILNVTGDYTQKSSGVYTFEMQGSTTAGTDYDQIAVGGDAKVGGFLNLSFLNGYRPAAGSNSASWTILTSTGAASGAFDLPVDVDQRESVGMDYSVEVNSNAVVLNAVQVYAPGDTDFDNDVESGEIAATVAAFTGAGDGTGAQINWSGGNFDQDDDVDTGDITSAISNLTAAQPSIAFPKLIYDPATGEVFIDADGIDILSFVLNSEAGLLAVFNQANLIADTANVTGLQDNTASVIGWVSASATTDVGYRGANFDPASIGEILGTGLTVTQLETMLTRAAWAGPLGTGGRFQIVSLSGGVTGDANGDGNLDFGDIEAFFLALTDPTNYAVQYPGVAISLLDMNEDGNTDFGDIGAFFTAVTGG